MVFLQKVISKVLNEVFNQVVCSEADFHFETFKGPLTAKLFFRLIDGNSIENSCGNF